MKTKIYLEQQLKSIERLIMFMCTVYVRMIVDKMSIERKLPYQNDITIKKSIIT